MRKITRDAVNAFRNNEDFKRDNTEVRADGNGTVMFLHGNCIAMTLRAGNLRVRAAGWETVTTKERLNGLLLAVGCQGIHQKDYVWYWDDETEFSSGWQEARPVDKGAA